MDTTLLQNKIETLQSTADRLFHMVTSSGCLYTDDLALLNREIHDKINELYPIHGRTVEQEAAICLAILTGYSVSMYANSEDEKRKLLVLERSHKIANELSPVPLKYQLLTVCEKMCCL